MSKQNNVNPDYYKTGGRGTQGRDVVQEIHRQQFAEAQAREDRVAHQTQNLAVNAQTVPGGEENKQTSSKEGKQSSAKKADTSRRNADAPSPKTSPVPGATGKQGEAPERDTAAGRNVDKAIQKERLNK